jgi:hypothetical protein
MILDTGTLKVTQWKEAKEWLIDNIVPWPYTVTVEDLYKWPWGFKIELSDEDAVAFKLKFQI